jgi:alkanesulfonate monooxygenase SsuD/methylene tetrahydromethanopterin reductase-like flavin-dependent oxidoreductase (luciferase family)
MTAIASAATSVVIGYLAGGTKTIRVGSGGVMLPNHSPLVNPQITQITQMKKTGGLS